jgi:hypothetical protein
MVKKDLIAAGDVAAIERLAAEAVRLARSVRPEPAGTSTDDRRIAGGAHDAI